MRETQEHIATELGRRLGALPYRPKDRPWIEGERRVDRKDCPLSVDFAVYENGMSEITVHVGASNPLDAPGLMDYLRSLLDAWDAAMKEGPDRAERRG